MAYTPTLWAKGDKVTSEKLNKIEQGIVDKVDKETGKTLSTNDFTNAYKTKLEDIEANADKTTIDATLTSSGAAADAKATGDAIQNIENDLDGKVATIESNLDEKVENLKSLVGTPLKATTASAMTDTSKIYVYTGNESGYTNGDWYYHDGSAWADGGTYNSVAVEVDDTLTVNGMPADAKVTGDAVSELKEDLNNVRTGSEFLWELGSLTPGTGAEQTGNTRVRSVFIPVTTGSVITLEDPKSRLLVYSYNANKQYIADSPWLGSNAFTVVDVSGVPTEWIRVLIRKNTSNEQISDSEIADLVAGLEIKYTLSSNTATEIRKISDLEKSIDGSRYITDLEIGGMTGGKPYKDTAYIRPKNFIRVNAGDVLTVHPTTFGLYNSVMYKYNTDNASGYTTSVTIPATTAGKTWKHTFTEDGWFKFRASNASSGAKINPEDLLSFNDVFYLEHFYDADELTKKIGPLGIDYFTINSQINGKFNLAIQTDTHMSKYVAYTSAEYLPSDFDDLKSVVNAINKLDIDLFANLGDFIRGYQSDPSYESRSNADAVMDIYKTIKTNKAFVIGNHDDGCLFYSNTTYNDNPSTQQVMFPNEQFNRYTKFGLNNKGKSNYYYADINGVRIIALYQRDFDYSSAIPQIEAFNISANQLSWFATTALDTNLPVIVLTHAPLVSSLYATSRSGFDEVLSALDSFVNGGGTVIAVLSGHTHAQNAEKVNGINHIVFKNGYDLFELVSVDLSNRTISCKAINGSSADLSLTY